MTIDRLHAVLTAIGPPPTAREIADALWLASHLDPLSTVPPLAPSLVSTTLPPRADTPRAPLPPREDVSVAVADDRGALHAKANIAGPGTDAVALLVPTAEMIGDRLTIQRALRPLKQRVPSRYGAVLDEEFTAHRLAEVPPGRPDWMPVLRPKLERWLDLALVVDGAASMTMWRPMVHELRQLLTEFGAFRDVRLWNLISHRGAVGISPAAAPGEVRGPGSLISPDGRRVVLVFSDCAHSVWWQGDAGRALERWARHGPVAILQPLPERLWNRTAATAQPGTIFPPRPGAPNTAMRFVPLEDSGDGSPGGVPVPVLELSARWLASWAGMVAGSATIGTPAAVTYVDDLQLLRARRAPMGVLSPRDRVLRFRAAASPEAFRLAGYLATTIPTLPVMRLVQRAMLGRARPADLAEVVLSGLLRVVDADSGQYKFVDGVREELLGTLSRSESWWAVEVLERVSAQIETRAGAAADRFRALLAVHSGSGAYRLASAGHPFSLVSQEALTRLIPTALPHTPVSAPPRPLEGPRPAPLQTRAARRPAHPPAAPRTPSPGKATDSYPLGSARGWPLTGRADELSRISELIRRRNGPAGVVLAGAAGVGKTRLAREVLAAAQQRGALTRWAVATASARALPLGAFAATLRVVDPDPARLVGQASEALLAGAGRSGVMVGVDDAHLLDELSAVLVHQLVLRRAASVVLTVRTGETAPDAVTALWKDGHLARLELQPLSVAETATLLEARLGALVDSTVARRLWTITQGNALYLRQLVDGELESERLHQVAGVWQWSGELALSPGLVELVSARIGRLPEAQRDVLEVLAFGEPLGVALLATLTDAVSVEQVEARGLIEVYSDGRRLHARLAHPLYGEVQRAQLGRLHARRLCGRIAWALGATGGRRADDTLRRAVLMLDSDLGLDPVLLTEAARRATELGDLALVARTARAAVSAGGGFEPRRLLSHALIWSGQGDEADTELIALGAEARTDDQRVQAATPRVGSLAFTLRRPVEAESVLGTIVGTISDDAAALELSGMRSTLEAFLGRTAQAAHTAAGVLAHPRCSPTAAHLAGWGLAAASGGLGRLERADESLARIDALAYGLHLAVVIVFYWLRGLLLAGLLDRADQVARRYRERCQDTPGAADVTTINMCAAVAMSGGQVQTAVRWYRQAIAAVHDADPGGWSYHDLVFLTGALGMAGDAAPARQALAEMTAARHPTYEYLQPDVHLAQAWVAAAEGGVSEALVLARKAAEVAASQVQPAMEVVALHTAVCFGDRTVADRLTQLATEVDGPRAGVAAAHAAALAADDGDALQAASVQLEKMGTLLLAADAAAQAAAVHTGHGRRGSAQAAAACAHRLAQTCEGARTPALAALSAPLSLTSREREIATLAASGLTNRQIAERLVVSVRTVENHLYRACTKLGITDRAELAAVLHGD